MIVKEFSQYIRDLETEQFVEAHFLEFPFYRTHIVMRIHDNKEAFLKDLNSNEIFPE